MNKSGAENEVEPLAARIRPRTWDEVIGQDHLVRPGMPLRTAAERNHRFSFILWGPPGVGKTTIARLYVQSIGIEWHELSAVSAGKDAIRSIVAKNDQPQALFLDEIHRFNKAQQDFLLPYVETGALTLIGATTENPSFEVIPALLSRCRVFTLESLTTEELHSVLNRTGYDMPEDAADYLVALANGDARQLITTLDHTHSLFGEITVDAIKKAGETRLRYDRQSDEHYQTVSAFIKSMRASAIDAALYYLARMVEAGEDPKFIARRMVIFASEDIGLAQPTALVVANAAFRAVETVGMPEAAIVLAQAAAYLARAPKDRRAYDALRAAQQAVRETGNLPVPLKLRNPTTKLQKSLGYGEEYTMYGDGDLLPKKLQGRTFFNDSPSKKS